MSQEKREFLLEVSISDISDEEMADLFDKFIELAEEKGASVGGGYHREEDEGDG
jgi:hypothetical protein